jgi:hypothetical protein
MPYPPALAQRTILISQLPSIVSYPSGTKSRGGYYSELEVIVKVSYTVGEESSLAMAGEDFRPNFE